MFAQLQGSPPDASVSQGSALVGHVNGVERPVAYLHPGRAFASSSGVPVVTILGSCVAVCLWDESTSAGGMIHFALPYAPQNNNADPFRYGDSGMSAVLEKVQGMGATRQGLRAKVFGGAGLLLGSEANAGRLGIQNVEVAFRGLLKAGIPIVSAETGGERGRKVLFHTHDGSAWVKQV